MKAHEAQGAKLNVPQEEMLLNRDQVRKGFHVQGANLNVPQEECYQTRTPGGGGVTAKPLGLGSVPLTGNAVA